jgi:hypothetical protein
LTAFLAVTALFLAGAAFFALARRAFFAALTGFERFALAAPARDLDALVRVGVFDLDLAISDSLFPILTG